MRIGRKSGDFQVDISDSASIRALFEQTGRFDALVCAAGNVNFVPLTDMTEKDFALGLQDKLMGQVNLLLLARIAPDLWQLIRWTLGNPGAGLACGLLVGCLIGVPLRIYQGIDASAIHGYWVWLPGMVVLAFGANALEEVLFRGFLQGYLEQHVTLLRAALISGVAFAACHGFLALSVTQLGWPVLLFTLIEGVACALVRMRYGVLPAAVAHGTAILLIAVPYIP